MRVIELAKKFVPATDEVWRLQRGDDPECIFFQTMANEGHYGNRPGASRQGIYVCAPSGKFLASVNSNNPDEVLETMQRGLKQWQSLPESERRLTKQAKIKPSHRWEDSFPKDGLVLTMFTRDLPKHAGADEQARAPKWNQDAVWFSKSEARQWLPVELKVGAEQELPQPPAIRLARLHLVDAVKGQTSTFSEDEIKKMEVRTKVVSVTGDEVTVEILGSSHADSTREFRRTSPHGVTTQMRGTATFDRKTEQFREFELVAIGKRWGHTRFNGRHHDPEENNLGFVFQLADPNSPRIAPAFVRNYQADWINQPNRQPQAN